MYSNQTQLIVTCPRLSLRVDPDRVLGYLNKTQGMHCVRIVMSESCNFINCFKGKNTVLVYL